VRRDPLEQPEARGVHVLEVVEHQQKGTHTRRRRQQVMEGVEQAQPGGGRSQVSAVAVAVPEKGERRAQCECVGRGEVSKDRRSPAFDEQAPQDLRPGPQGGRAGGLGAADRERLEAPTRQTRRELLQEPGLPDAGRPGDEPEAHAPAAHVLDEALAGPGSHLAPQHAQRLAQGGVRHLDFRPQLAYQLVARDDPVPVVDQVREESSGERRERARAGEPAHRALVRQPLQVELGKLDASCRLPNHGPSAPAEAGRTQGLRGRQVLGTVRLQR